MDRQLTCETLPIALRFHGARGEDTAFALRFYCISWLRHCLWLVRSTASLVNALPLPNVDKALACALRSSVDGEEHFGYATDNAG